MSKKPSNGIDYTPRRAAAIEAQARARRPMERHVHGVVQRKQLHPIFAVYAAGKCIEWTDSRAVAHSVFQHSGVMPRHLYAVSDNGARTLLNHVSVTGRKYEPETATA